MKPGRGIFCPFRVNPRIFSSSPTRLTLPLCPSALLLSLFALPPLSSPSIRPIDLRYLLHCFHLHPSSHVFFACTFFLYSSFFSRILVPLFVPGFISLYVSLSLFFWRHKISTRLIR